MKCDNCQRPILNPIDHEFCTYMAEALPVIKHKSSKLSVGARIRESVGPIVKRDEYVAPKVQGNLNHQIAKPGSKPPVETLIPGLRNAFHLGVEGEENPYRSNILKANE